MVLTLKWISGRTNAAYRREFMGEITSMRKAVDTANAMAKSAKDESIQTEKQARINFWLTSSFSLAAIIVSIWAILK